MSFFDQLHRYYIGKKHEVILLEGCKTKLKKAGVFHKVISRVKKVCDTGNFGVLNKRYKYFKRKNIGWLKWNDGTRVYYSVFDSDKIIQFYCELNCFVGQSC